MAYWSDPTLVPKRQNRFLFNANIGSAGESVQFLVKTSGRPGFTVTEAEHRFLSHKFYFPGIVEWETLDVTLVDPVSPNAANIMYKALQDMGWGAPSSTEAAQGSIVSKKQAVQEGINGVNVVTLDGDGAQADVFHLENCWIQSVKFGDMDYSGDDLVDITLTLRFDWARYEAIQS